jgi:hypothetical protein
MTSASSGRPNFQANRSICRHSVRAMYYRSVTTVFHTVIHRNCGRRRELLGRLRVCRAGCLSSRPCGDPFNRYVQRRRLLLDPLSGVARRGMDLRGGRPLSYGRGSRKRRLLHVSSSPKAIPRHSAGPLCACQESGRARAVRGAIAVPGRR